MATESGRSPKGSGYSAEPEPSCTVSAVPVSIPNASLTDQEHYYFHSILRCLRALSDRLPDEQQLVRTPEEQRVFSLQSMALDDNIDWLDCFIEARCPTRGDCDQCWPKDMAA